MATREKPSKSIGSTQSLSSFVKSICDIMRTANCASALQYVPELTWILFLRILDAQEEKAREAAEVVGKPYTPALQAPYRWQDWAAPDGERRKALKTKVGQLFAFIDTELLPYLHNLDIKPDGRPNLAASPKQRVIGRIMTAVEHVRVDSETSLCDILDKVNQISIDHINDQHFFTLSQVYEDLLLKMGEKNSDGGQFFTPREVVRAMVKTINPQLGETVYDPCCGTGGFLAQAYELMAKDLGAKTSATDVARLKHETFFGREKENLVFPIALANLVLHGIDQPNLWHGNSLSGDPTYDALFENAPSTFDVILTNPPFGGKEGKAAQKNYSFETSSTQVLFMQRILQELKPALNGKPGGRCAVVLDEGLLFRTNESAFVETKRKLLDECDLWCIVSLPGGVFSTAGAGVKTNLLFFTKGKRTEKIWYYDLSHIKMGKKSPMTLAHFGWDSKFNPLQEDTTSFANLLAARSTSKGDSRFSWTVDFSARRAEAQARMAPLRIQVEQHKSELVLLREKMTALKKAKTAQTKLDAIKAEIEALEKSARAVQSQLDSIDAAVYDLKAVNPHVKTDSDTRSVDDLLKAIEGYGKTVSNSLSTLRGLLVNT
jgi:type I restriction enzyme M protein